MESGNPVAVVASEVRKLTEVVMKLLSECETNRLRMQNFEKTMNECKEMLYEVRTSQKELSKLFEGSKVFVIGDVNACRNQTTGVHSQESISVEVPAQDDQVNHILVNHQQMEPGVKDVYGLSPGPVTSNQQSYEMPSQKNLKLIQLVEAAAVQVAREENMKRGTPTDNSNSSYDDHHVMVTPSQVVPESGGPTSNYKRLCCTIAPSPSIYSTGNVYPKNQRRAWMDIVSVNPPSRASYPIRTPREKLLQCNFCPRLFEHHHSAMLHMRSCRKKHDESFRISRGCVSQENRFIDLIIADPKLDKGGSSRQNQSRRSVLCTPRVEKMIKCGHCERTFPTRHQVVCHERVHTGLRPYTCYVCGVKFAHGCNMIKHFKSKHPLEKPYMCRYCQNNFKIHADVLQHRKQCVVRLALLKDRKSSTRERKSRRREREGDETETASEDESSRPWASAAD